MDKEDSEFAERIQEAWGAVGVPICTEWYSRKRTTRYAALVLERLNSTGESEYGWYLGSVPEIAIKLNQLDEESNWIPEGMKEDLRDEVIDGDFNKLSIYFKFLEDWAMIKLNRGFTSSIN